ncbi:MAG: hypothetical protein WCS69_04345 [Ignavibacteriaceae bacterium]
MKFFYKFLLAVVVLACAIYPQNVSMLTTNKIESGEIVYFENAKDSSELTKRYNYFLKAKIVLKNETKGSEVTARESIGVKDGELVFIKFVDNAIKNMAGDDFALYLDNVLVKRTDSVSAIGGGVFKLDLKPSLDAAEAQKLDLVWGRKFVESYTNGTAMNVDLNLKGAFSSKPDSAALNSVQIKGGYTFIFTDVGLFKYLGLNGNIGSEHPQNFSQTNMVGSVAFSTVLPWTDILARVIANNRTNASIGLLLQPAIEFVKNTTVKDSSYLRGAIHGGWDIPLLKNQYVSFYGVAYFQKGYQPRSYVEMTLEQDLSESLAVVAKWVNGALPPLFQHEADFRIGLRFK